MHKSTYYTQHTTIFIKESSADLVTWYETLKYGGPVDIRVRYIDYTEPGVNHNL